MKKHVFWTLSFLFGYLSFIQAQAYNYNNNFESDDYDANLIIEPTQEKGGIYLGAVTAALDNSYIKKQKIKSVLSIMNNYNQKQKDSENINHLIISAPDHPDFELINHFEKAIEFIENARKNGSVLVHCYAGVSRSSTIVIAQLMKEKKIGFNEAFNLVQGKRNKIGPNIGFIHQLKEWQKRLNIKVDI